MNYHTIVNVYAEEVRSSITTIEKLFLSDLNLVYKHEFIIWSSIYEGLLSYLLTDVIRIKHNHIYIYIQWVGMIQKLGSFKS